jgi:hypothetical protein
VHVCSGEELLDKGLGGGHGGVGAHGVVDDVPALQHLQEEATARAVTALSQHNNQWGI